MRLLYRFALPLLGVLALMAVILAPLADGLIARWFQHDLEMRSKLLASSIRDTVVRMIEDRAPQQLEALFDRIAEDERILAIGLCGSDGILLESSRTGRAMLSCRDLTTKEAPTFQLLDLLRGPVLAASLPVETRDRGQARLIILHDLSFVSARSLSARFYLMGFIAILGVAAAGVTLLMARLTLRGWIRSMRAGLAGGTPDGGGVQDPQIAPVIGEIRQLLRDLDISRRTAAGIRVDWSPDTLRQVVDNELPGAEVIVVSNREPYIHNRDAEGSIALQRPASGLVTALEPIVKACGGTWIAHGNGSADRETVDAADRVRVPPEEPAYTLRRVWLSPREEEGYYFGLANEGLWPLCHITFVRPIFREPDWEQYRAVNQKFADAVIAEAKTDAPVVLVQDYHLALVPRMIRERLPNATIITFWHIPWPNAEVFGICPWRTDILEGLLGSSVIGFHTQLHCNNFIETADRFIACHIDREQAMVSSLGNSALVRPYPISIAWPPEPLIGQAPVPECRAAVFKRFDLPPETRLAVGVERFDFTKGIPDRFRAVEILLEKHPEWRGRLVLLQVAAPTRSKLPTYQALRAEAESVAAQVNDRFGRDGYRPIILEMQHFEPEQVYELFRASDLCIVSSLHDGMNLVAKEFVAARDDEHGALILSTFAGASRELMEALIVNPFDARATAEAIDQALRMPPQEQQERMRLMRDVVSENNVFYWAGRMLLDASRLRKRNRIMSNIARVATAPGPLQRIA
jgi:trehalose 6-phosphate synthase